jgi:hypothetical protein
MLSPPHRSGVKNSRAPPPLPTGREDPSLLRLSLWLSAEASSTRPAFRSMNDRIYRYGLLIRLAHWTNQLCLTILLMSGLQIFNAHPALYGGEASDFDYPLRSIPAFPGSRSRAYKTSRQAACGISSLRGYS